MKEIKNIAFDFGGVVLALSLEGAIKTFEKIGVKAARQRLDAFHQKGVFEDLEAGRISMEEFRVAMCQLVGKEVSLQDCYEAWHGYVDYVPQQNLDMLLRLRGKGYQVCLLSNTNPFMMMWAESPEFDGQGHPVSYYFDKLYLSYQCGVMKPAPKIFQMMLEGQNALPEETLFIDDSETNVKVAQSLGIHTLCPHDNEDWTRFPEIQELLLE
jgi:putative hydrolase of the HAD superfamily